MVKVDTTCRAGCGKPVDGASLCEDCVTDIRGALGDAADLALALDAAYLKQQRFSTSGAPGTNPDESPVPFNEKAGRLRRELSVELLRWLMHVHQATGVSWAPPTARATTSSLAQQLIDGLGYLRTHPEGGDAHRALVGLRERILTAVDRPPDDIYLGECSIPNERGEDCPADLYAEWGSDHMTCPRCRHVHSVADRRSVLLVAVKDQLVPAEDIARGLTGALDMKVTGERIRKWKERGRIASRSTNPKGQPLYRVGDVIDLLLADQEREAAKGKRRSER